MTAAVVPLSCQTEAARFASTPADALRLIDAALSNLAESLATATTHAARRDALDAAAGVLARVERASGRVGAVRTYEVRG